MGYGDERKAKCTLEWCHDDFRSDEEPWLSQTVSSEATRGSQSMDHAVTYALRAYCDHNPALLVCFLAKILAGLAETGWLAGYEEEAKRFYNVVCPSACRKLKLRERKRLASGQLAKGTTSKCRKK